MTAGPAISIPRVATSRLLLRELRPGDFDDFADNLADPIATKHISGVTDRRKAWQVFAAATGAWLLHGAGWWGVEHVELGKLVGMVGAFFRETSPDLEIGWNVYRPFWGRGIASEAAAAAVAFGLDAHKRTRVIAHVSSTNAASIRVSQRIGMHYERDVKLYDETIGRYAIET